MVSPVASAVDHDMELDSEALRQLRCRGKVNMTVSETSSRCEWLAARAGRVVRFLDMYVVKKAKEVLRGIEREVEGLSQMEPSGSIRRAVPAGWGECMGDGRPALLLLPCPALRPGCRLPHAHHWLYTPRGGHAAVHACLSPGYSSED